MYFKKAEKMDYTKLTYDFVLTSPPYYDKEKLSSEQGNVGEAETTPVKALPLAWAAIKGLFSSNK